MPAVVEFRCPRRFVVFLQKGQVDEAIAHYQRALEIKPDYAEAHGNSWRSSRSVSTKAVERLGRGREHKEPQKPPTTSPLPEHLGRGGLNHAGGAADR
jgi:hypothetical protein